VIEWFRDTLESRKNSKDTPIILMMQRLHEEDLAGWLLSGGNGEHWEHINLPALREDGTSLWPSKHSVEDLKRMEEATPWVFSSQYQQKPVPAGGVIFKTDKFIIEDARPKSRIKKFRAWDFAATDDDGDWTVGALVSQSADKRHTVEDVKRFRGGPEEVEKQLVATAKVDGPDVYISLPKDPGQAGKSQVMYFTRVLSGFRVFDSPETGDKATRAAPFASQVNVGNVAIVRGEWNLPFLREVGSFPYGKHDDQVDAASRGFNALNEGSNYDASLGWVGD
jgi:predicted phage terminase large subunit-like protein